MAPKYKLIYFNEKGRGETVRWLFSYANVPFEDFRIQSMDEWGKLKPSTPFGKLPILEVDGKQLIESMAMTRFVAKTVNLAGKNAWEEAQIDAMVDTINEYIKVTWESMMEPNEEAKKTKIETFKKETSPYYLSRLDKIVKENNGCLANGQLSWADIHFASCVDSVTSFNLVDISPYSNLKALYDKVTNIPQIKNWIATRPASSKYS